MTEQLKRTLNIYQNRLLDISSRNRLINSRFTSQKGLQHFGIIDSVPDVIYKKLNDQNGKMKFTSLPPMDELNEEDEEFLIALENEKLTDPTYIQNIQNGFSEDEATLELKGRLLDTHQEEFSIESHAERHDISPSWNLPLEPSKPSHSQRSIQTLMMKDVLLRKLKSISRYYKSSLKEQGVNPLFLSFGYLEWKENQNSRTKFLSPLLMLKVNIGEVNGDYSITSAGENLIMNQSLNEKLKKDFGFNLPEPPEESDEAEGDTNLIKNFFVVLKSHLENHQPNWEIKEWGSLGIYNSQNIPIYLDLEELKKKEPSDLLIRMFDGQNGEIDPPSNELHDVDNLELEENKILPELVIDADASQYSAVIEACRGENFVIKGPPGTGKSQTITNTISALMQQGKSVLFIAQKQAALDVVRNNLIEAGLKPFLLDIFSIRSDKTSVMNSLNERLEFSITRNGNYDLATVKERVKDNRRRLNKYRDAVSNKIGDTGLTAYEIIWNRYSYKNPFETEIDLESKLFNKISLKSDESLVEIKDNLQTILDKYNDLFNGKNIHDYIFGGINIPQDNLDEISEKISSSNDFLNAFKQRKEEFCAENNFVSNLDELKSSIKNFIIDIFCYTDEQTKKKLVKISLSDEHIDNFQKLVKLDKKLQNISDWEEFDQLNKAEESLKKTKSSIKKDKKYLKESFLKPPKTNDLNRWKKIFEGAGIFYFFSFEWRTAKKEFIEIRHLSQSYSKNQILEEINKALKSLKDVKRNEKKVPELEENINRLVSKRNKEIENTEEELENLKNFFSTYYGDLNLEELIFHYNSQEFNKFKGMIKKLDENLKLELLSEDNRRIFHDYLIFLKESNSNLEECKDLYEILKGSPSVSLDELIEFFNELCGSTISLQNFLEWRSFINDPHELTSEHANDIIDYFLEFLEKKLNLELIFQFFDFLVSEERLSHVSQLQLPSGRTLDGYIKTFKRDDKKLNDLSRKNLIRDVYDFGNDVPSGRGGLVSEKTEKTLVEYVSNTPRTRVSIRDIFSRANRTLSAMKPCVMMSPLTVSQTLTLDNTFDVLLIDEASQMKPEYAVGAIARAKQIIVVGDNKQLPPTNFFQRDTDDDDEDFESESILDLTLGTFSNPRDLIYHYRSRHEDLIKFSNEKFYNNLLIPCSANSLDSNKGIRYEYVEDGMYITSSGGVAGSVNPIEAKKVIDILEDLIISRSDESIGIATMNSKQSEYIQNELDLRRLQNEQISDYIDKWSEDNEGINELFIKNLENIQGDERDIIIVSTLYGKNENGTVFQRFGPIARENGWRRLNVLFTRAKNQMIVVSSLKSHEIRESENTPLGTKIFKEYLYYVESGQIARGEPFQAEIDNPFQQWAIDQINSLPGFSADWEIGEKGYRIDIGVKHERYPGYILAVETDGATYHSSLSARDRDILRQQILEGYGWKFYRIWSTDWLRDPVTERQKLHDALNGRLLSLGNPQLDL